MASNCFRWLRSWPAIVSTNTLKAISPRSGVSELLSQCGACCELDLHQILMRRHKKIPASMSAQAVDNLARNVMNQMARLMQNTEELHANVKRAEDIHHEVEETLQQAKHTLKHAERRRGTD
jgi:hypothetical protein